MSWSIGLMVFSRRGKGGRKIWSEQERQMELPIKSAQRFIAYLPMYVAC